MPLTLPAMPDPAGSPATTVDGRSRVDVVRAQIEAFIHHTWLPYAAAGILLALLTVSLMARRKRGHAEIAGTKQALTRTDRAITRITGMLATAVVATGAWKVFGLPALHLNPVFRVILFAFAEAQVVAAWRRVRRHINRHAELGPGTRTIYGIALGSATVAAFDAAALVEVLLRFFAAFVAAYMIVEELAEELDIYLEEHPEKRTEERKKAKRGLFGLKWALTPERVMVWLRLAEPTERTVEEVERQRRVARMARTAHRLQTLKAAKAADWRIGWARRSLRRQTEQANEHLNLAGDPAALDAVRAQLALLFEVEDRTTREAVGDASPLAPKSAAVLNESPQASLQAPQHGTHDGAQRDAHAGNPGERINGSQPEFAPASGSEKVPATPGEKPVAKPAGRPAASAANGAKRPTHPFADDPNPSMRALAKAYAANPTKTNAELAKRAKVSEGTANRYLPKIRAAAIDAANADADEERAQGPLIGLPIPEPKPFAVAAVNGHSLTPEEN
jgi:hypothetical protein